MNYLTLDRSLLRENRKLTTMVDKALQEGKPLNNKEVVIQSQKVDRIINQLFAIQNAMQKRSESVG